MLQTLLYVVGLAALIWVIYDIFTNNKKLSTTSKIIWIVCAVLFSVITAIVYYFVFKNK